MSKLKSLFTDESAATAVEYAVMLAAILLTMILAIGAFGTQTGGMWGNIDTELQGHGFN